MAKKKNRNSEDGALSNLLRDLAQAVQTEGNIHISADVALKSETALQQVRDRSLSVRSSMVKEIVALLESEKSLCSRLDANAFRLVLETLLLADNRNESKARGLYILAKSLYEDEHDPARKPLVRHKKLKLFDEMFLVLLRRFCRTDKHANSAVQWTIGLILENLFYFDDIDIEHMNFLFDTFDLSPETDKVALFSFIFNATDEISIAICGRILRSMSRLGVNMESLWPRELSQQALIEFPEVSRDSQAWQSLFENFVDDGCKLLDKPNSLTALHYLYVLSSEPNIIDSQKSDLTTLVAKDRLIVHIASENRGPFDRFLEIPNELVHGAERLHPESTGTSELSTIKLQIGKSDRAFSRVNFQQASIGVLNAIPLHDVDQDLLYQDLVDLIPASLKVFRPSQSVTFQRDASMMSRSARPRSACSTSSIDVIQKPVKESDVFTTGPRGHSNDNIDVIPCLDHGIVPGLALSPSNGENNFIPTANMRYHGEVGQNQRLDVPMDVLSHPSKHTVPKASTRKDEDVNIGRGSSNAKSVSIGISPTEVFTADVKDDMDKDNIVETFDLDMNSFIADMDCSDESAPYRQILPEYEKDIPRDSPTFSKPKDLSPMLIVPSIEADELLPLDVDDLAVRKFPSQWTQVSAYLACDKLSPQLEISSRDRCRRTQNFTMLPPDPSQHTAKAKLLKKTKMTLKAKKPIILGGREIGHEVKPRVEKTETPAERAGSRNMGKRERKLSNREISERVPIAASVPRSFSHAKRALRNNDSTKKKTDRSTGKSRNTYGRKSVKSLVAKPKSFDASFRSSNSMTGAVGALPHDLPLPPRLTYSTTKSPLHAAGADQIDARANVEDAHIAISIDSDKRSMQNAKHHGGGHLNAVQQISAKQVKEQTLEQEDQFQSMDRASKENLQVPSSDAFVYPMDEAGRNDKASTTPDQVAYKQKQQTGISTAGKRLASRLGKLGLDTRVATRRRDGWQHKTNNSKNKTHDVNVNTSMSCIDVDDPHAGTSKEQDASRNKTKSGSQPNSQLVHASIAEDKMTVAFGDDERHIERTETKTPDELTVTKARLATHETVADLVPREIVANMLVYDTPQVMNSPTNIHDRGIIGASLHEVSACDDIGSSPKPSGSSHSCSSHSCSAYPSNNHLLVSEEAGRSTTILWSIDQSLPTVDINNTQHLDRTKSAARALNKALNVEYRVKEVVPTLPITGADIASNNRQRDNFLLSNSNNGDATSDQDLGSPSQIGESESATSREAADEALQQSRTWRQAEDFHGKDASVSREIGDSTALSTYVDDDITKHLDSIRVTKMYSDVVRPETDHHLTSRITQVAESGSPMIAKVSKAQTAHDVAKRARFQDALTTSPVDPYQAKLKAPKHTALVSKSTNTKLRTNEPTKLQLCVSEGQPWVPKCRAARVFSRQQPPDGQAKTAHLSSAGDNPLLAGDSFDSPTKKVPKTKLVQRLHDAYIQNNKAHVALTESVSDRKTPAADLEKTLVNDDSDSGTQNQENQGGLQTTHPFHDAQLPLGQERDWFDALKPFYMRETQLQLTEICNTLIRHLSKKEIAVKDVVAEYREGASLLLGDLTQDYSNNKSNLSKNFDWRLQLVVNDYKAAQAFLNCCIEQVRGSCVTKDEERWQTRQNVLQNRLQHVRGYGNA